MTMRYARELAIAACCVPAAAAAACGGSPGSVNTTCGPGTVAENGSCQVVSSQDGSADSAIFDADLDGDGTSSGKDANALDGVQSDDGSPDSVPDDAASPDGGPTQSDPCPYDPDSGLSQDPSFIECDPHCGKTYPGFLDASARLCPQTKCSAMPTLPLSLGLGTTVMRTPDAPGTDPNCAVQCPNGDYVYGIGLQISASLGDLLVRVGSPWEIIEYSQKPFCADSHAVVATNCAYVYVPATSGVVEDLYIMTKDPGAPARNITFEGANGKTSCP
jgi:hypothetical protein